MSGGFSDPIIGGGGVLVYPSIHSPNFVTGSSGWSIKKDGSAEFNNLVIRNGTIISGMLLVYSGTPALGNPPQFAVVAPGITQDPFGNTITSSKILIQGNVITEAGGVFRTAAASPLMQLDGPHNAFLVYDSNAILRETIAPAVTNDGLGDTVQAGFTSYGTLNTTFTQLVSGQLLFKQSIDTTGPSIQELLGSAGVLQIFSGGTGLLVVPAEIQLFPVVTGQGAVVAINHMLELIETPAVPAALAGAQLFSSPASGMIRFVSDSTHGDSNAYDTGRLSLVLANTFTINNTVPLTILSAPVGIGTYEVEVWLVTQNTTAADAAGFAFTGPAAAAAPQLVDFESKTTGTAVVGYGASGTYTTTFNGQGVAGNQQVLMRATIKFTAAGTLALTGKELVAGNTVTVSAGSRMRLSPVG